MWRPAVVTARLATVTTFDDPADSFRILQTWLRVAPELFPEFLDSQEPLRMGISPDKIESSRAARFGPAWYATRQRPRLFVHLMRAARDHASLSVSAFDRAGAPDLATRIAALIDAWSETAYPDYGMVHVLCEHERNEATVLGRGDLVGDAEAGEVSWGFTAQLRTGLPTLYWRNLFGRPYVELFGRERLRSAPAFAVIEQPWGYALQLTPDPPGDASYGEYRQVRERVIEHLGRAAFGVEMAQHRAQHVPEFGPFPARQFIQRP
jgi:hypothetical protein